MPSQQEKYESVGNGTAALDRRCAALSRKIQTLFQESRFLVHLSSLQSVKSWPDFVRPCSIAIEAALALTNAEMSDLQVWDPATSTLRLIAHRGVPPAFTKYFATVPAGSMACGTAWLQKKRILVENVEKSPFFAHDQALPVMRAARVRAVRSVPLVTYTGHALGVMSTLSSHVCPLTAQQEQRLDRLASAIAGVLHRMDAPYQGGKYERQAERSR